MKVVLNYTQLANVHGNHHLNYKHAIIAVATTFRYSATAWCQANHIKQANQ